MFKPGDLVRHRSRPEWGLGRITGQTGEGKVLVKFTSRTGDVLLTADGAAAHLMADSGASGAHSQQAARHVAPVRRTPCVTCAADVRDVVTSADGVWRSCVACSGRNGRQHVFLPYPAAFDVLVPATVASPGVLVAAMPGGAGRGVAAGDTGLGVAVGDTRLGVAVGDISGTVVDAEPIDDPRAGWCRACKTGSRASGYRNCSDVMR